MLCSNKTPSRLCYRSNEKIQGEEGGGCPSVSAWCAQEFLSFKALLSTQEDHRGDSTAMSAPQLQLPLPSVLCVTHILATAPAVAPGQCICHPFVCQKSLSYKLRPSVNGGNTYSFFSRAKSSCLPSASIRSFSDVGWLWWDNRQERGWEKLVMESGTQHFEWGRVALVADQVLEH